MQRSKTKKRVAVGRDKAERKVRESSGKVKSGLIVVGFASLGLRRVFRGL